MLLLIMLQTASPALPDIELRVRAQAKSVTVEQSGQTRLEVHADPDGGSRVDSHSAPARNGRTSYRNITVDINGHANIADPQEKAIPPETAPGN